MEHQIRELADIFENQFSYEHYNGIALSSMPFTIKQGTKNVLISAPHSVNQIRENTVKAADLYTGSIASIVQLYTNCFCIYSNRMMEEDPNYVMGGLYKSALRELCIHYPIKLVIDLHGASLNHDFDVDIGTLYGVSIDEEKIDVMTNIFSCHGIQNVRRNDTFSASHEGTVTSFMAKELYIDAVQMEINRCYRNPQQNIHAFTMLIQSLIEMIDLFGKDI